MSWKPWERKTSGVDDDDDDDDDHEDDGSSSSSSKYGKKRVVFDTDNTVESPPPGSGPEPPPPPGPESKADAMNKTSPSTRYKSWNKFRSPLEETLIQTMRRYNRSPVLRMSVAQKRLVFFWHLYMLCGAITVIGYGAFIKYSLDDYILDQIIFKESVKYYKDFVAFGENPQLKYFYGKVPMEYGDTFMALGIMYIAVCCLYISFLAHKLAFTWPITVLITILGLTVELSNLLVRLSPDAQLSSTQQRAVIKEIPNYKVNSPDIFALTYDLISIWGTCCGIQSKFDFQFSSIIFTEKKSGNFFEHTLQVPPTCCNASVLTEGTDAVITCAKTLQGTHDIGCYETFFTMIESVQPYYITIGTVLVVDLVIHIYIYRGMVHSLDCEMGLESLSQLERKRQKDWVQIRQDILQSWEDGKEPTGLLKK